MDLVAGFWWLLTFSFIQLQADLISSPVPSRILYFYGCCNWMMNQTFTWEMVVASPLPSIKKLAVCGFNFGARSSSLLQKFWRSVSRQNLGPKRRKRLSPCSELHEEINHQIYEYFLPTIMVQWKMGVSPRSVSFHLGQVSLWIVSTFCELHEQNPTKFKGAGCGPGITGTICDPICQVIKVGLRSGIPHLPSKVHSKILRFIPLLSLPPLT